MTGLSGSKIYMFVSFASILGGAATLIGTSTNLIIAGLVTDAINSGQVQNMQPITMFEPTKIGLPAAVVGILFMMFIASRLLPEHEAETADEATKRMYRAEFVVIPNSTLAGKTIEEAGIAQSSGYHLASMTKSDGIANPITSTTRLNENDRLEFVAEADAIPALWATIGLKPAHSAGPKAGKDRHEHSLVEVVVSARAISVGHRISELPLPGSPYNVHIVGVSRQGQAPEISLADWRVEAGDSGVLEVDDAFFYENRSEVDFILKKRLKGYSVQRVDRSVAAIAITVVMISLAAFGIMSMLNAALLAGLEMLLSGCITPQRAFRSIDWETVVVLGAAVGLAAPITDTGLAQSLADLLNALGSGNPNAALAAVFLGCIIMTNIITNAAAASFMFPIALSLANSMGLNFLPFVMIMMMGTSYAFINPAGYQTNLMVQKPGGYTFGDFSKVGLPLTILVGIVVLVLAPIIYGF
jgi:di/tricarboxylate transporter